MFEKVRYYDPSLPVLKWSFPVFRWSLLFLYDLIFSISSNKKNTNGKVLKKFENNSNTGRKFKKLHDQNVEKLLKANRDYVFDGKLNLPEIDYQDFNTEQFRKWKKEVNMPIVIRGFLKDAKAIDLLSKESLVNSYGDIDVKCMTFENEKADESRAGQNINLIETKMRDFILSDEFEEYYINNFYGILNDRDFLNLCKGREIDQVQGKNNVFTQWFISRSQNTASTLHNAAGENMFLNIHGQKEWHFVHPSYTPIMKTTLSKYGAFASSEFDEPIKGDFYQNLTNTESFMKNVPIFHVLLEEGDMLFNPPWWWHTVRNKTPFTVGCATRYWEYKHSTQNASTLAHGITIELIKNPKRSFTYKLYKMIRNKKNAVNFLDSAFTGND